MADIRGLRKTITYSDDNPISEWIEELREKRRAEKREPKNEAERKLLAQWLGFRGRAELDDIVGTACYAYSHFDMDPEWRYLLADHIRTGSHYDEGSETGKRIWEAGAKALFTGWDYPPDQENQVVRWILEAWGFPTGKGK
ncbi:MAG: hypothetical protein ACREQW_11975 [Candidatus Binatia bacterium]